MKINKYPDGSSYVNEVGIGLHNNTFKINDYKDLWHLNQAVEAYYNKFETKPTITIPNLIDAQADRRFNKDGSSGLKLVCKFLNDLNANFKIFHPHNSEVVEALMDNVEIIDNSTFINRVLYSVTAGKKRKEHNLILMSSDAGGFKPLMRLCNKLDWEGKTYSASKYRADYGDGMKLYQEVDRQDFKGKDILIIDDISIYGGTFKGLANLLKDRNCGKLYLAVSHMTVQNLGKDPVTNYFDKVFTTNSKFNYYQYEYMLNSITESKKQPENLEIINLF